MYLKVIELIGFKSFAEKTRIELNADFTAIVGPNGSGKSNITEAIKWVLGEQSAKSLRGERMDDVIFAGSSSKSRSQYAEVSLEFDNTDHTLALEQTDVRITRRITRKGESTYRINGKQCRLKDITELMMDTGIGKHSFSVISQGRVEEIFNQKAEERRAIFEEAAGVTKYKAKKQEAERKLTQARENQDRLDDIMSEIETRLDPLKAQRDVALTYQEKKAALSDIEIALISVEIEAESKAWEMSKQELAQIENGIRREKADLQTAHEQLQRQQAQEAEAAQTRDDLHNELVTVVQQLEQAQAAVELAQQRFEFQQKDQAQREQRLLDLEVEAQTRAKDYATAQEQLATLTEQVQEKTTAEQHCQDDLQTLEGSRTVNMEELRNRYFDALQEQNRLKNQWSALEKDQALRDQQQVEGKRRQREWEQTQAQLLQQQTEAQADVEAASQAVSAVIARYQEQAQALQQTQQKEQALKKDYEQAHQLALRTTAEYESLKALEANYEGFYAGVKNALQLKKDLPGIYGAVAQLLTVPTDYTLAVETALGAQMQHIITETGEVAEQVIQRLKAQRGGRATFLPLDVMRPRHLAPAEIEVAASVPGYRGVLVDLVTFEPKYQPVMANLMGNTIVTQDLASARLINQRLKRRVRVVSVEGDLVHAGGSLTGGMNRNNQQGVLLERRQKLTAYEAKHHAQQQQLHQLKTAWDAATTALVAHQEELATLKESGTEARYQERAAKQELERINNELAQNEKARAGAQYEDTIRQEDEAQATATKDRLHTALSEAEQTIATLKQQIETANASEETYQREHAQLLQAATEAQTTLAVAKEQQKQQRLTVDRLKQAATEAHEALISLQSQMQTLAMDQETFQREQKDQQQQIQAKQQRQKALKQEQAQAKHAQAVAQQAINVWTEKQEAHNLTLERYYQEQTTIQARISRYEVTIDTHLEHLREDYGLTFERARAQSELTLSVEAAAERVKQLKREIDHLGTVNLQAIAEYDEVKQRYDFMTAQREDVLAAITNLEQTITTLDQEVSEKFKASFLAIQSAFETIFPKLFGGGKATLNLTAPDDLLHTGIEIMAQPPGKKLQLMSLLSGGERSLTAIALLFAMIAVNPVPFSILDEVEAALDDANVERYGEYLQHYAEKTQFIVITHRKGTMAHANLLYGVTMEQAGISKLASVALENLDWVDAPQTSA